MTQNCLKSFQQSRKELLQHLAKDHNWGYEDLSEWRLSDADKIKGQLVNGCSNCLNDYLAVRQEKMKGFHIDNGYIFCNPYTNQKMSKVSYKRAVR